MNEEQAMAAVTARAQVRAVTAYGVEVATGRAVGYQQHPTMVIDTGRGGRVHWALPLVEALDPGARLRDLAARLEADSTPDRVAEIAAQLRGIAESITPTAEEHADA